MPPTLRMDKLQSKVGGIDMLNFIENSKEIKAISDRFIINDTHEGLLVTAHAQLILPEKKIVLPDSFTEKETQLIKTMTSKGGLIL